MIAVVIVYCLLGSASACLDLFGIMERITSADVLPFYHCYCFLIVYVFCRSGLLDDVNVEDTGDHRCYYTSADTLIVGQSLEQ